MPEYLITPLSDKPEYKKEVIELIERSFEYASDQKFETDFHLLFNDKNHQNCFLILDQSSKQLIGHIGTKPRFFHVESKKIKTVFIGGIAIKENYRGRGVFKSAFKTILEALKNDYEYAFLWSENPNIYRQYGFQEIETLEININNPEHTEQSLKEIGFEKTKLQFISENKLSEIKKLYKEEINLKFISPSRSDQIWNEVINTSSIDLFIKNDSSGSLSAYCMVGKGQDMKGFIHEYASTDTKTIYEIKQISGLFYHDKNALSQIPVAYGMKLADSDDVKKFLVEIKNKGLYIPGVDSI